MVKPVLLAIDDDPEVLRAVARDLKARYGDRFRVLDAPSGASGLDLIAELELRQTPVALFLVDQRMPSLSGTGFMVRAGEAYPEAKRVLLTAYTDTDAAIDAINTARVDHYLLKPWHPAETKLYPVLDDLLADWLAAFRPAFEGVRLVGARWSPAAHDLKGVLDPQPDPLYVARHGAAGGRRAYARAGRQRSRRPAAGDLPGWQRLAPGHRGVGGAEARSGYACAGAGLRLDHRRRRPVWSGGSRRRASEGLKTLLVERSAPGVQAGDSSRIENYLGFPSGVSGAELARRATSQARRLGAEMLVPHEVAAVEVDGPYRRVRFADGGAMAVSSIHRYLATL